MIRVLRIFDVQVGKIFRQDGQLAEEPFVAAGGE